MLLTAALISLALHADPPTKAASSDTVKDLAKNAMKDDGPDVSQLPFTADTIKQIVVSNQPKIQSCYEEHLSNKKKAPEGSLKTAFIITAEGYVKSAKVDRRASSLKDPGLHDCVVAVLSAMVFPRPPDAKEHPIEFPFNLKAVN